MLAAVFEDNGKLVLKERPQPKLTRDTDVLLKVTAVGICGTDLHILQVPPAHPAKVGSILGHEFTGEVAEVGAAVTEVAPGDHVLVDPHPGCGKCEECRSGHPDRCIPLYNSATAPGHCATIGIFSDGAMTSYAVVPAHALYKVDRSVPAHIAALAEPLGCVVSAADKLKVQPGDTVVVLGAGPIGLLFTSLLKASGAAKILVSEVSEYRRAAARDCGAARVVDPKHEDLAAVVREEMPGGADVVVEAVGPLLPQAIELAHSSGRVLQFGHDELARPAIPVAELLRKELTISGAFIGKFAFHKLPRILASGVLPLERIVSHQLPLSRVHEGIDLLRQGKGIKIVLHPDGY
jgi:(R,R)-butanediol dehydrogenase/meso-butanediol dehydrogenase/diacetyl reductase